MPNKPYTQPLQYAVAGATSIPCKTWARRVEIAEDGAVATFSGLKVTYPDGIVVTYPPEQQPIVLTDKAAEGAGASRFMGRPAQTDGAPLYPGDTYCVIAPATVGVATVVNVWEYS